MFGQSNPKRIFPDTLFLALSHLLFEELFSLFEDVKHPDSYWIHITALMPSKTIEQFLGEGKERKKKKKIHTLGRGKKKYS